MQFESAKNIENKLFFKNTWAYFQVNLTHFDIHALPWQKLIGNKF